MLRRAPTAITLSNLDIIEHLEHMNQQKRYDRENLLYGKGRGKGSRPSTSPALLDIGNVSAGDLFCEDEDRNEIFSTFDFDKLRHRDGGSSATLSHGSDEHSPDGIPSPRAGAIYRPGGRQPPGPGFYSVGVYPHPLSEDGEDLISVSYAESSEQLDEPPMLRHEEYSDHRSKVVAHAFDYGGFVESPGDDSSSFVPQDISTPRNSEVQRLRSRVPLPRSPLFLSQAASSPEKRLTSLTPRVATYSTPGILLSQPPRRPRSYRPRTISYSFEESERASTTREQIGRSDEDSAESQEHHRQPRESEEGVHGRSSPSVSLAGDVPSSPPRFIERRDSLADFGGLDRSAELDRMLDFSSPRLPLPPPFSAVPRNLSSIETIPALQGSPSPSRGPSRSISRSPRKLEVTGLQASPAVRPFSPSPGEEDTSPETSSIFHNLAGLPLRLLSAYRSRSPFQTRSEVADESTSSPSSPTPRRRSQARSSPQSSPPTRHHRQLQVYDDQVPASLQPQTPQHLPEARHQSRFHPSYTAPAGPGLGRGGSPRPSASRASLRRKTRSDSPTGLQTPGFWGLYGGRENSDDEAMFDGASRRLWTLSSARSRGRSTRGTNSG